MENELITIDPKEYGIEEKKAQEIAKIFSPMLDRMVELEKEYNAVSSMEMSKDKIKAAHDLRLKYVKTRTETAAIHKQMKDFYLKGGRFVDGWKNAQLMAAQGIEEDLKGIEKYYERLEQERKKKIAEDRAAILAAFDVAPVSDLGDMAEDVWENYISGVEMNYKAKKEAEEKAEADRIAREKAEREEQERIRKENERLKKEAEEREVAAKAEREERERIAAEERARREAEEKARQQAEEKRRKEEAERVRIAEEKARKEREAIELKLKKEREERERLQREKQELEEREERERQEKIEAELSKGDADKIKDLLAELEGIKTKYTFKSKKNIKTFNGVCELLDKVIAYIK